MQVHFCPEGATVIIHDTPKRLATMPNRDEKGVWPQRHLHLTAFGQRSEMPIGLGNKITIFCAHIFYQCFCRGVQAYNERGSVFRTSFFQAQSRGTLRKIRDVHL
jgi:hypothetical protein